MPRRTRRTSPRSELVIGQDSSFRKDPKFMKTEKKAKRRYPSDLDFDLELDLDLNLTLQRDLSTFVDDVDQGRKQESHGK